MSGMLKGKEGKRGEEGRGGVCGVYVCVLWHLGGWIDGWMDDDDAGSRKIL